VLFANDGDLADTPGDAAKPLELNERAAAMRINPSLSRVGTGIAGTPLVMKPESSDPEVREVNRNVADDVVRDDDRSMNRDPITGAPGSHPVGTGLGSAGGAAAGAAIGAPAGPVGALVGGIIGAIAGGAAGHGIAESIDPTAEEAYWSENYRNEPYVEEDYDYADYQPAYRMGYERYPNYQGRQYEDAERELEKEWDEARGSSRLDWDRARPAARAGWQRVERGRAGETGAADI